MIHWNISLIMTDLIQNLGDAVAEWSKALLREKINENQKKIPGLPPGLGKLLKKIRILKIKKKVLRLDQKSRDCFFSLMGFMIIQNVWLEIREATQQVSS